MNSIRIAPEYGCHPTWIKRHEETVFLPVDPLTLDISRPLAKSLVDWANWFESTYVEEDPASSGFQSDDEERDFIALGRTLARQLMSEVDGLDEVTYFDLFTQTYEAL